MFAKRKLSLYKDFFNRHIVAITIGFILVVIAATNFTHARYNSTSRVIEWDIKSYYAYLPVFFIYQDPALKFREENPEKFSDLIWPVYLPTGRPAIQMTMGMSVLYMPFFLAGHTVALLSNFEPDGYSRPYRFALTFSGLFYLWAGLYFLVRILRRFFRDSIVAVTLIAIVLGTNLYYYATYEAPMTHTANFALITLFLWLTIRFYDRPSLQRIILPGVLAGLIALIRPNNIIVLLLFFLWNVKSMGDIQQRVLFFWKRYYWVLLMAVLFTLAWVPQFVYWHWVSGKIFFNAYTLRNEGFYFDDPQVLNIMFSYRKGWLIYTPMMIFSLAGFFWLPRKVPGLLLPLTVFMIINVYILSSWWCWWYGGTFGSRPFIDSYGLLAIPFACFTDFAFRQKRIFNYVFVFVVLLLLSFNFNQTRQYDKGYIHFDSMDKGTYWDVFLKKHPSERYWEMLEDAKVGYLQEQLDKNEQQKQKKRSFD